MERFFRNPTQVIYRCKRGKKFFCGIAYERSIISARSGVVIPILEVEEVRELQWRDLFESFKVEEIEEMRDKV